MNKKDFQWLQGDFTPDDILPPVPGWYPILHEWEAPEGFFPKAAYWDGDQWLCGPHGDIIPGAILWLAEVQPTKEAAKLVAKQNDMDI